MEDEKPGPKIMHDGFIAVKKHSSKQIIDIAARYYDFKRMRHL